MEDYELAINLARKIRDDDTWCPYISYVSLELNSGGVPRLIMCYTENKDRPHNDNEYSWLYIKDKWVQEPKISIDEGDKNERQGNKT